MFAMPQKPLIAFVDAANACANTTMEEIMKALTTAALARAPTSSPADQIGETLQPTKICRV